MTADWPQGWRGAESGRNTWKADAPDRSVPAPALWAGALGARMHFSLGLLCGLHCGIHASTLAHSGRPETLFSEAFGRSKKWRMGELTGGEGGIRTPDRLAPMPHFECGAFNHSATSPEGAILGAGPLWLGAFISEDGGPDKARKGKIRCLFRPIGPWPAAGTRNGLPELRF